MREFKFRAWDKEDKRMIVAEQDFIPLLVTHVGVMRLDPTIKENRWVLAPLERFEIMQYTGLQDKNGVEIYEGDIVRLCGGECCYGVWQHDSIETIKDIRVVGCFDVCEEITIIGNIHEVQDEHS